MRLGDYDSGRVFVMEFRDEETAQFGTVCTGLRASKISSSDKDSLCEYLGFDMNNDKIHLGEMDYGDWYSDIPPMVASGVRSRPDPESDQYGVPSLTFGSVTFNRYSRSVHGVGACNEGLNELALACIYADASSSYNANSISSEVMDKREVKVNSALHRMRRDLAQPKRSGIWTQWAEWERCDEWRYLENTLPDTVFRVRECVDPANPEDEAYLDCPGSRAFFEERKCDRPTLSTRTQEPINVDYNTEYYHVPTTEPTLDPSSDSSNSLNSSKSSGSGSSGSDSSLPEDEYSDDSYSDYEYSQSESPFDELDIGNKKVFEISDSSRNVYEDSGEISY